ncbi:MAG: TraB/GumN family protein [Chakrabartia sp.]
MTKVFSRSLVSLAAALNLVAAPAFSAPSRDADPALWVMRDADTTVYLFGTVHLLPAGLSWFDDAVLKAFDASDELQMEILPVEDLASLAPLIMKLAVDPKGRTMAQRLSPEEHEAYRNALLNIGLPADQLEPLEPWFVALQASVLLYAKAGYHPKLGAEEILTQAAKKAGKKLTAFETPEEQFSILDSTPEAEQLIGIRDLIYKSDQQMALLNKVLDHWEQGKAEEAGQLLNEEMKNTPETVRLSLTDRNARWAKQLQARMAQPGTVFVAVGAGHLAGANSVQDYLTRAGFKIERISY